VGELLWLRQRIGDTITNLRSAVHAEIYEFSDMYSGMAKTAREEGSSEVADWFEMLAKAGRSYAGRFAKAMEVLNRSSTPGGAMGYPARSKA
jgi:rubrerythrin